MSVICPISKASKMGNAFYSRSQTFFFDKNAFLTFFIFFLTFITSVIFACSTIIFTKSPATGV